jgi:hypothetical protein
MVSIAQPSCALEVARKAMTHPTPTIDRTIDSIIELGKCCADHRILLAGAQEPDRIPGWRSRGYRRVETITTCRLPRGQYDVAFVQWRQHSVKALETMLDWLVYFLSPRGVLVVRIDGNTGRGGELLPALERLGFCVETGRRCRNSFAFSARRLNADR